MDVLSVTLNEVLAAAGIRAASLVPETSGYLALAVADASSRLPFRLDDPMVSLTTEGTVKVARGTIVVAPDESARRMRDLLARLLSHSVGSAPALVAASRPRAESPEGVDGFIRELEAALVPVNRAAARRALARLARETARARHAGRLRRRRTRKPEGEAPEQRTAAQAEPPAAPPARRSAPGHAPAAAPLRAQAPEDPGVDVEFSDPPNAVDEARDVITAAAAARRPPSIPSAPAAAMIELLDARSMADAVDPWADAEPTPIEPQPTLWEEAPTTIDAQVDLVAEPAPNDHPGAAPARGMISFSSSLAKSNVDDLIDRFAVSELTSPEGIEKTRAALKKLAGLDPTPPPPSASELRRLTARPPAVAPRSVEAQLILRRTATVVADRSRTPRAATIALVALGLVLAGLLGHYLPSWLGEARANAEATP